jgi:hypothetical protein
VATHRYISTTFWDDAWIQELDPSEKFVYMYLMTNPLTSISGVYKITDRRISFDTGYNADTVKNIMTKFSMAGKAIRKGEWIILPTWPKHQNWEKSPTIKQGIIQELKALPDDIFKTLHDVHYRFDIDFVLPERTPEKVKGNNETSSTDTPSETGDTPPIPYIYPIYTPEGSTDKASTILFNSNSIKNSFNINSIGNSNGDSKSPPCEQPVENQPEKPPPNFYKLIKEKVKAAGYYTDEPVARKIAKAIPDYTWFTRPHSIIDFVTEKIGDIYSEKPDPERKKLFISALISWENIRDEYPDWLALQIEKDKKNALEKLRNTPPKHCVKCGIELEGRICPKCKGRVLFDEEQQDWKYQEYFDVSIGFRENQKRLRGGQELDETPEKLQEENVDDIDF